MPRWSVTNYLSELLRIAAPRPRAAHAPLARDVAAIAAALSRLPTARMRSWR